MGSKEDSSSRLSLQHPHAPPLPGSSRLNHTITGERSVADVGAQAGLDRLIQPFLAAQRGN